MLRVYQVLMRCLLKEAVLPGRLRSTIPASLDTVGERKSCTAWREWREPRGAGATGSLVGPAHAGREVIMRIKIHVELITDWEEASTVEACEFARPMTEFAAETVGLLLDD